MSKKEQKQVKKGNKINGKKASAEKYVQLYEFLLFDPIYKSMSPRAKIMYSYLRSKVPYFEMETEKHHEGVAGTKSYMDDEGNIYILADNSELIYMFGCSEPTIVSTKKELERYGLLHQEELYQQANRMYILEPSELTDVWSYKQEMIELRDERKLERKKKNEELKKKKKGKKEEKKHDLKNLSSNDLKNLSSNDLKNLSSNDLKNLSEIELNIFKSNLISKIKLNPSILEEIKNILKEKGLDGLIDDSIENVKDESIKNLELPESIKNTLYKNRNRIDGDKININGIVELYVEYKELMEEYEFNKKLVDVFAVKNIRIDFMSYLHTSLMNYLEKKKTPQNQVDSGSNSKDIQADWYNKGLHKMTKEEYEKYRAENLESQKVMSEDEEKVAILLKQYSN